MTNSQVGDIVTVIHTQKKKNILTNITHRDRYEWGWVRICYLFHKQIRVGSLQTEERTVVELIELILPQSSSRVKV